MGYRDSDDSGFSRHGMGRDADDMRFGERGYSREHGSSGHQGYGGAPEPRTGYRPELDDRSERYGQYGMQRGYDDRADSGGRYSPQGRDRGSSYPSHDRFSGPGGGYYDGRENRGARYGAGRWDAPTGPLSDAYQDHGNGGAYGFLRNSPGGRQHGSHAERDHDYQQWRDEALRLLDEDYDAWRKERYQKFSEDFNSWRSNRAGNDSRAGGASGASAQQQGKTNPGAGPTSGSVGGGTSGASSSKGKEPLG